MNKAMIIVGMGEGLSMGIAEYFGAQGFTIGMVSRTAAKLEKLKQLLSQKNISACFATADASDTQQLLAALDELAEQLGQVDILQYNAVDYRYVPILQESIEDLVTGFRVSVGNAFASSMHLLPLLKATQGAILLTGGGSGLNPNPDFATISLGKAGIRNLALQLHQALKPEGVFAGTVTINGWIRHESETHSPAILAKKFWELYSSRDAAELAY